jgi:hypothetical protein
LALLALASTDPAVVLVEVMVVLPALDGAAVAAVVVANTLDTVVGDVVAVVAVPFTAPSVVVDVAAVRALLAPHPPSASKSIRSARASWTDRGSRGRVWSAVAGSVASGGMDRMGTSFVGSRRGIACATVPYANRV